MPIRDRVSELLQSRGLTQQQLADCLGWGKRKISRICTGKQECKESEVRALCDVLGVGPGELFAELPLLRVER